jgi:TPR repeat protein
MAYGMMLQSQGRKKEGARFLKRAFETDDPYCKGICKFYGYCVDKNKEEAFDLFNQAVGDGQIDTIKQLAQCYYFGW